MSAKSVPLRNNTSLPYPPELVRRRYNRLAPWYRLFEWIFWLPRGIRSRAIRKLELRQGDAVLEVGCGTGRNLSYLQEAVGSNGHIFGVDVCADLRNLTDHVTVEEELFGDYFICQGRKGT